MGDEFLEIWKSVKPYKWYILIAIVWFWQRGRMGSFVYSYKADVYALVVFGLLMLKDQFLQAEQYKCPQFVANGVHASCTDTPILIYPYLVFRLGGVKFLGIVGTYATVIVPSKLGFNLRDNYISTVRVEQIDFSQVPMSLQNVLVRNNFPLDRIYYGIVPEEYEIENPGVVFDNIQRLDENYVVTLKNDALKGKLEHIEEVAGAHSRVAERVGRKEGVIDRFRRSVNRRKDDEED